MEQQRRNYQQQQNQQNQQQQQQQQPNPQMQMQQQLQSHTQFQSQQIAEEQNYYNTSNNILNTSNANSGSGHLSNLNNVNATIQYAQPTHSQVHSNNNQISSSGTQQYAAAQYDQSIQPSGGFLH